MFDTPDGADHSPCKVNGESYRRDARGAPAAKDGRDSCSLPIAAAVHGDARDSDAARRIRAAAHGGTPRDTVSTFAASSSCDYRIAVAFVATRGAFSHGG